MSMIAVLGLACAGSVGAMAGALAVAASPAGWRSRLQPLLLAYSAGTLLAAALLGMLPRAFAALPGPQAGLTVLAGFLLLYAIERASVWHHCHDGSCAARRGRGRLILIGDAFHNFVDGLLIAAAFLADPMLGITTTLAVVAHEIPQELGDFILLLNAGWSRRKAFLANAASSLTSVLGGLLGYFALDGAEHFLPYVLTIAAASFIYIAVADLLPLLHRQRSNFALQSALIGLGVMVVPLVGQWVH